MHDTLGYVQHDPVHRAYHHGELTFALVYAWSENYVLPISHDEVVHGKGSLLRKMPGDRWRSWPTCAPTSPSCGRTPASSCCSWAAEMGQESEWAESRELDWWLLDHPEHRGVHSLVRDLNRPTSTRRRCGARRRPGRLPVGRRQRRRPQRLLVHPPRPRRGPDLVCVSNFSAVPHEGYRLGLPSAGQWDEVLNTDAEVYTGSGVGNLGAVTAVEGDHLGQPAYADIVVPPLATVWFRPARLSLAKAERRRGSDARSTASRDR